MSKRLLQIAVLVVTVYFAVDVGQQTGWSPKAYVGALIALAATILTFDREGLLDRQSLISTYHRRRVVR
jgi:hypothetical protein